MRQARGEHPRLTRARAGQNQHRPLDRLDGRALFRVQADEIVGSADGKVDTGEI